MSGMLEIGDRVVWQGSHNQRFAPFGIVVRADDESGGQVEVLWDDGKYRNYLYSPEYLRLSDAPYPDNIDTLLDKFASEMDQLSKAIDKITRITGVNSNGE